MADSGHYDGSGLDKFLMRKWVMKNKMKAMMGGGWCNVVRRIC